MQMFRHDHEPMQEKAALVSIVKQRFHEQLGVGSSRKERAPLIGRGCEGIGIHGSLRKAYLRG